MTGKEGGSQKNKPPRSWKDALIYIMFYKNQEPITLQQEYKPLTRIMTCIYFLARSSTSIKRPQPPFGHPNESLVSLYLLLIVVKKKLLLPYWNQKLSFALFSQQKKHLHVRHRSVLIQVCFFESTGLFSLYHCIKSGTCHLFSHKILGCFPGEARDILIPYLGRIVLFSALNWKSPPPLPLVNFWQVPY